MRWVVCATVLLGCDDTEFTPRWRLDRFRVLAVVADAPDAEAGETVTLRVVTADHAGASRAVGVAWLPCSRRAMDNATGAFSCPSAAGVLMGESVRMVLPEAAGDGSPWSVLGMACAGGALRVDAPTTLPRCEGGEGELFVRTIRRRRGEANHNPRVVRVLLDGVELTETASAAVAPCAIAGDDAREDGCRHHALRVEFASDARETVTEVQPDGSARTLREALVTEFVVDGGDLAGAFRSDNDAEGVVTAHTNTYLAPASGTVRLWVVLRDGRGGFDVASRTMRVGR